MSMKSKLYEYLKDHPPAFDLFKNLELSGNIYLIGGVLREFLDNGKLCNLRDIDIVVDVKDEEHWRRTLNQYALRSNRFGGHKLICDGLLVDTWAIGETWAFRENIILCSPDEYANLLPDTVFLNIDGIIFDWEREIWFDKKYRQAMETKTIDVVLRKNPQIPLNIVRAFVLKQRYEMKFSEVLKQVIRIEYKKHSDIESFVEMLMVEQLRRYKDIIILKEILLKELSQIIQTATDIA